MELVKAELPKSHRIAFAGDMHRGSLAFHFKGWKSLLERVRKERDLYLVLMGDLLECILIDDKRFQIEIHGLKNFFVHQLAELKAELWGVRKKIITVHFGNHEAKLFKLGDFIHDLCDEIHVPYGGFSAKTTVWSLSGEALYKIYSTHGRLTVNSTADDPVRRRSNMQLTIKRRLQDFAGDAVVMVTGHAHKLIVVPPEREMYMIDDGTEIRARYTKAVQHGDYIDPALRFYACTGSFLKSTILGATTYSEASMYRPVQLGYPELVVKDGVVTEFREVHLGSDTPPEMC